MSTIKSKEDPAYAVKEDDLMPLVNNAGSVPKSPTITQLRKKLNETTRLEGRKMIFNPNDFGVYANTDAVVEATPNGGTLEIINDYYVSVHGVIALNKGIILQGQGWGRADVVGSPTAGSDGTKIINDGVTPAANCITVHGDLDPSESYVMGNPVIRDFWIWHEGSGYAIDLKHGSHGKLENCRIDMGGIGAGGIKLSTDGTEGSSATFWILMDKLWIRNFTSRGIYFNQPKGSKNRVSNCLIRSEELSALCAIEIYCKDTMVDNCQADVVGNPAIIVRAGAAYGRDSTGIVIKNHLSEEDKVMVKTVGDGGDYVVNNLVITNPIMSSGNSSRAFFYLDYAYNSIVEIPLAYGSLIFNANFGKLGTLTANTSGNLVKVMGEHTLLDYVDDGVGNKLVVENCTDKQLMRMPYTSGKHFMPMMDALDGGLVRSSTTELDGVTGVWTPTGTPFKTPYDIPDCQCFLDAGRIGNLYTDAERTTRVSASGDAVKGWNDEDFDNNGIYFSGLENIDSIGLGASTTINVPAGEYHTAAVGNQVRIQYVTETTQGAGGSINAVHNVLSVSGVESFVIDFNSTGANYDIATAKYRVIENIPTYEADVGGLGIPGIYFDGVSAVLRGPAIPLDTSTGTIICVGWCTDDTTGDDHAFIGRHFGTDSVFLDKLNSEIRYVAEFQQTAFWKPTIIGVNQGPGFVAARKGFTLTSINYGMEAESKEANTQTFLRNTKTWQIGSDGAASKLFKGYIHAIVIYDRELTDIEVKQLELYFTAKYKCIVGSTNEW